MNTKTNEQPTTGPPENRVDGFQFLQTHPPGILADLVDEIWHARGTVSYGSERILPNPKPILIFNLGEGFEVQTAEDRQPVRRTGGWLVGPQDQFMWHRPLAETNAIGVVLKPWGASALFDLSSRDLQNRTVALDAFWGPSPESFRDRLVQAGTPLQSIGLLAEALIERRAAPAPEATRYAANRLASPFAPTVNEMANELGVSRKHLNNLFDRYVGLPPKAYAQVHRFTRAVNALSRAIPPPLALAAIEAGYYDQAHMNRDFARFAGATPTEYLNRRSRHFADGDDDSGLFLPGF